MTLNQYAGALRTLVSQRRLSVAAANAYWARAVASIHRSPPPLRSRPSQMPITGRVPTTIPRAPPHQLGLPASIAKVVDAPIASVVEDFIPGAAEAVLGAAIGGPVGAIVAPLVASAVTGLVNDIFGDAFGPVALPSVEQVARGTPAGPTLGPIAARQLRD